MTNLKAMHNTTPRRSYPTDELLTLFLLTKNWGWTTYNILAWKLVSKTIQMGENTYPEDDIVFPNSLHNFFVFRPLRMLQPSLLWLTFSTSILTYVQQPYKTIWNQITSTLEILGAALRLPKSFLFLSSYPLVCYNTPERCMLKNQLSSIEFMVSFTCSTFCCFVSQINGL